jgi:HAD superfamily hydrolase (TIGR01548 family)
LKPEIIVFDIDGVLIDTSRSFRCAVSRTVQYYMTEILGYKDTGILIEPEEVQLFKLAGGFNDDWILSQSAILFFLYKGLKYELGDTGSIRLALPSLIEFTGAISSYKDGGLEKTRRYLAGLDGDILNKAEEKLDRSLVIRIFQEIYAGSDYVERLYGSKPILGREEGLWKNERVILDKSLLLEDVLYGIYTGRTASETQLALEILKLDIPSGAIVTMGSSIEKPDPKGLEIIREYYKKDILAFVGDSMDDVLSAINAKAIPVAIANDKISRERFSHHTSLIFSDVNEYLRYLRGSK